MTASTEDNEPLLDAFGVDAGFNMQVSQPCNPMSTVLFMPTDKWTLLYWLADAQRA